MRLGLFRRMALAYAALLIASFIFVQYYLNGLIEGARIEYLIRGMEAETALIAEGLELRPGEDLDALCRRYKELTGSRVTIIWSGGDVLGDSDFDSSGLDNHIGRPEVQQALIEGRGSAVRVSATDGRRMLYTAGRVGPEDSPRGYVRLAMPLEQLEREVSALLMRVMGAIVVVMAAAAWLTFRQSLRVRRLVEDIRGYSGELARGELGNRLILDEDEGGEFEEITSNLGQLASDMDVAIKKSREEYERLKVLLESLPDALLLMDQAGRVVLKSRATESFLGAAPLVGRQAAGAVRSAEFIQLLDAAIETGMPQEGEMTIERPVRRNALLKISPVRYRSGEAPGFVAIMHDVTEIRRLDEVRKDFVANVSHELKTPVAAIKGFADTLLDGALDDKEHAGRFVGIIKSNAERINALVEDLMTISKVEMGVIGVRKEALMLEELAGATLDNFRQRAAARGLVLETSFDPRVIRIEADRMRLIQILSNLLDNALKYTERGRVVLGSEMHGGLGPCLYVSDTGPGVPDEYLGRLGERFFRVDTSRSRELGGTGLGLAIVKHLVKAHEWRLVFENQEGRGLKVIIALGG